VTRAPPRAVLLDVLGTLLRMESPGPRLRAELARRTGVDVGEAAAEAAFRAEIEYYLEHQLEGRDPESLDELRDRCAEVVRSATGFERMELAAVREAMLAALRFEPWPDAPRALRALRQAGLRRVAASNWDCSLPHFLQRAGLSPLLDGAVASAVVGAAKPDPRLFQAALERAGCGPDEAVHVGDSLDNDVVGARRAGIRAVLLVRSGAADAPAGLPAIRTLEELPALVLAGR
jgi:putative hydrolase of the HAD superfamily